jgi:hypothetical protein
MNLKISFKERAKLAAANLSKQTPYTLEEAKKQVLWLQEKSTAKNKKQRNS